MLPLKEAALSRKQPFRRPNSPNGKKTSSFFWLNEKYQNPKQSNKYYQVFQKSNYWRSTISDKIRIGIDQSFFKKIIIEMSFLPVQRMEKGDTKYAIPVVAEFLQFWQQEALRGERNEKKMSIFFNPQAIASKDMQKFKCSLV